MAKKRQLSPDQQALKDAYMKERRRVQNRIYKARKKGFEVDVTVPKIPKRITQGSINRLNKMQPEYIYKHSTYNAIELDTETGEFTLRKVSGLEGLKNRQELGRLAAKQTREFNKARKLEEEKREKRRKREEERRRESEAREKARQERVLYAETTQKELDEQARKRDDEYERTKNEEFDHDNPPIYTTPEEPDKSQSEAFSGFTEEEIESMHRAGYDDAYIEEFYTDIGFISEQDARQLYREELENMYGGALLSSKQQKSMNSLIDSLVDYAIEVERKYGSGTADEFIYGLGEVEQWMLYEPEVLAANIANAMWFLRPSQDELKDLQQIMENNENWNGLHWDYDKWSDNTRANSFNIETGEYYGYRSKNK